MSNTLTYSYSFVNGVFGDPVMEVVNKLNGSIYLFDLGDLKHYNAKSFNKVEFVFVSHTHMDHFCGFDHLLRARISSKKSLTFVGPKGLAQQIQSKILGYTWNLIEPEQLSFIVYEIEDHHATRMARFSKASEFSFDYETIHLESLDVDANTKVEFVALDHNGIDSIAYYVSFPDRINLIQDKFETSGLAQGPWMSELQKRYFNGELTSQITIDENVYEADKLFTELFSVKKENFIYVTDIGFTKENIQKISARFSQTLVLFCETNFLSGDSDRAKNKAHLTTKYACLLGRYLQAEQLISFHYSSIYREKSDIQNEIDEYWNKFSKLSPQKLKELIERESYAN